MRDITTHKTNGLNEALRIRAIGETGPGGAIADYVIRVPLKNGVSRNDVIQFQRGNPAEEINGITNEALLAIVRDRLEGFQSGQFACTTNQRALDGVVSAMEALRERTKDRISRGVEGTQDR